MYERELDMHDRGGVAGFAMCLCASVKLRSDCDTDTTFKTTPHMYKLNFTRGTKVFKVKANEIPMNLFVFMPFQDILACVKEDRLLDVIGHVVEKDVIKEIEKNGKISKVMDTTLEDLE
ncbi:replication factor A protein [Trifolium pratense]|uniref:Replication factor A protein n=1 Tax=Trifolium pratense TaxID=57577 RepID=A0A2K3NZ26_TRIPR|nr:replication factor A protein [Trifolium pratense]